MANKHMKRWSTSFIFRGKPIKTTIRYHFTPIRVADGYQKQKQKITVLRRMRRIGTLVRFQWECKMLQPPWKSIWWFLKKLNTDLPYDPAIPLLGIHPKKLKTLI